MLRVNARATNDKVLKRFERNSIMSDQTMKAVRFYAPGDIRVEEIPVPQPGPGEVVIKNKVTLTCGDRRQDL